MVRERSIASLSSGERRRVALALALGFGEVVAQRGRLNCSLLVLDEVWEVGVHKAMLWTHVCAGRSCSLRVLEL